MSAEALVAFLPPELRDLLRRRTLGLRRPVVGASHGRHRSTRPGQGLDFRDHRPYVAGDDLRRLDWRAAARRDRLVLRQMEAEDELSLCLVLDAGGGMGYGEGATGKLAMARGLAASLAWLAAAQGDPVGFAIGQGGEAHTAAARPRRGAERLAALARTLDTVQPTGLCPWSSLLADLAAALPRRSLVVVVSDLLDPEGRGTTASDEHLLGALARLRARRHDVVVLQVLHRDELEFPWRDRKTLRFVDLWRARPDLEGAGSAMREGYLERFAAHTAWWQAGAEREGLVLERVVSDEPMAGAVVRLLGRLGGVMHEASPTGASP